MSLVSVIIPNYNHAPFLKERIESVLNQTYENIEIIILDDCSTDNSKDIIEEYRNHKKIKHIEYNTTNSGSTFIQWKKGIELAQGDWIWIAESDDIAEPSFLEELIALKGEIKFCSSNIIDHQSKDATVYGFRTMPSKEHYQEFKESFSCESKFHITKWMLTDNFIPNASGVLFKKSIGQKVINRLFNDLKDMKLMGDWLFWLAFLSESNSLSYSSQALNHFRNHEGTVRSSKVKNRSLEMDAIFKELKRQKINKKKTISTFLYRYLNDENVKNSFTFRERMKMLILSLKHGFFITYLKSRIKN